MKDELLRNYVGKNIQLKFAGDPHPVGPVELEVASTDHAWLIFRINLPAMMQAPGGRQPVQVIMPIDFDADAVVWVSEGPNNAEGDKLVHDIPAPGGRTAGGIVIPPR